MYQYDDYNHALVRERVAQFRDQVQRRLSDVLRDPLSHMRQCGFDAFAVRAGKSLADALKGLGGIGVLYGRLAIEPRPLFRRR